MVAVRGLFNLCDGSRDGTVTYQAHEKGVASRYIRIFLKRFLNINAR